MRSLQEADAYLLGERRCRRHQCATISANARSRFIRGSEADAGCSGAPVMHAPRVNPEFFTTAISWLPRSGPMHTIRDTGTEDAHAGIRGGVGSRFPGRLFRQHFRGKWYCRGRFGRFHRADEHLGLALERRIQHRDCRKCDILGGVVEYWNSLLHLRRNRDHGNDYERRLELVRNYGRLIGRLMYPADIGRMPGDQRLLSWSRLFRLPGGWSRLLHSANAAMHLELRVLFRLVYSRKLWLFRRTPGMYRAQPVL